MQLVRHLAALSIPGDPRCYYHDKLRALTAREMAIRPVLALLLCRNNGLHSTLHGTLNVCRTLRMSLQASIIPCLIQLASTTPWAGLMPILLTCRSSHLEIDLNSCLISCSANVSYILIWRVIFTCILDALMTRCFFVINRLDSIKTHFSWALLLKYQRLLKLNQYVMFLDEN